MNISWKFEEVSFINNKAVSVRTCVCNTFLNMTSLTSIIMFWRQQPCLNICLHYVHAENDNPRKVYIPKSFICEPVFALCEQQRCRSACTSTFVVRCLDGIILLVSISKISSLYLASVAEQACLSLPWSQTPKTGFLIYISCFVISFQNDALCF